MKMLGMTYGKTGSLLYVGYHQVQQWVSGAAEAPYWACRLLALEHGVFWPLGPATNADHLEPPSGMSQAWVEAARPERLVLEGGMVKDDVREGWRRKDGTVTPPLIRVPMLSVHLNIPVTTIYRWIDGGKVPPKSLVYLEGDTRPWFDAQVLGEAGWLDSALLRKSDAVKLQPGLKFFYDYTKLNPDAIVQVSGQMRFKEHYLTPPWCKFLYKEKK
jgi:hypothetical protein